MRISATSALFSTCLAAKESLGVPDTRLPPERHPPFEKDPHLGGQKLQRQRRLRGEVIDDKHTCDTGGAVVSNAGGGGWQGGEGAGDVGGWDHTRQPDGAAGVVGDGRIRLKKCLLKAEMENL